MIMFVIVNIGHLGYIVRYFRTEEGRRSHQYADGCLASPVHARLYRNHPTPTLVVRVSQRTWLALLSSFPMVASFPCRSWCSLSVAFAESARES